MLLRTTSLSVGLLLLAAAAAVAGDEHHKAANTDSPGFERFKQLAGEWVGKSDKPGHGAEGGQHVVFKVTSAGSAVEETMFPGTEHEMLTHYCAVGNQPEMKAPDKVDGNDVAFKFVRGGNMKSPNEMHMHSVTYTFVGKDTLRTKWINYSDGKPAGDIVFEFKRKK
jgi:hypothetical protein